MLAHAPEYADRWVAGFEAAINSLRVMPQRCPLVPETHLAIRGIRHLLYESYRILFVVRDPEVNVVEVRHMRRRPVKERRKKSPPG